MSVDQLPGEVRVVGDAVALGGAAAEWLSSVSAASPVLRVAVSGGSTPHFLYEALASSTFRGGIDWNRWHLFFCDERAVPPDHDQSNYRLVRDTLLSRVTVPESQVHRMRADSGDLEAAAAAYSELLESECGSAPPRLDMVLLGLGENGHVASLFPGTAALAVEDAWATPGRADYEPFDRLTLTFPTINAAARVAFLVSGPAKAAALRGVIEGTVPAARVKPADGSLVWFLDAAAARSLG